ncbi:ATP-binding protein [Pseudalkalibacillus hwajinpoensis]|uniref:ATP-binding protein n=1 Tax=Guptibacillus hwajinpoensis TaxID=208199 RepID=UPI00325B5BBB
MNEFTYTFPFFLITISILLIVSYGYTAFDFHEKAIRMEGAYRKIWLFGSSLALGSGIWILQYISLLGLSPNISAHYQPWFVIASLLIPVGGALLSFIVLSLSMQPFRAILLAAIPITTSLLLLKILSSVYLLKETYSLSTWWQIVVPGLIALVSSVSSFWLVYGITAEKRNAWGKIAGAIVLGIAVSMINYFMMMRVSGNTQVEIENYSDNMLLQSIVITGIFIISVLILISVVRDRKLEFQAYQLQESERRYHSLVENNPDGIMLLDLNGQVLNMNPSLEGISGYSAKETKYTTCFKIVEDRFHERTMNCFEETKTGIPQKCESAIIHKIGHSVRVKLISIPHVVDGKMKGVIVIVEDITELKKTEELLRRSEKLTAVGELAAGVAHEIRNPLTSLKGFSNLLYSSATDEKSQEFLQIMLSEIDRINFIVSEFMLLARPQEKEFAEGDLISLLRHVVTLLKTQAILKNIVIRTQYDFDRLPIICEENQLKQVFVNVLKNAIEAMPSGGVITLKVMKSESNEAIVIITDQGVGIPLDKLPRIGEPFYTLKENGTGLGLMVSFNIIENHSGRMNLTSIEGEGTTVEVVLPFEENKLVSI